VVDSTSCYLAGRHGNRRDSLDVGAGFAADLGLMRELCAYSSSLAIHRGSDRLDQPL